MYLKIIISMLFIMLLSACSNGDSVDMKEGKWNITTTTIMKGMPFQVPPVTVSQCMKKGAYLPKQQKGNDANCKIINKGVNGSTVTWSVECPKSKSYGSITYKHNTFSGELNTEINSPSGVMKMTSKMQGKYIGECN